VAAEVKICGITRPEDAAAAAEAGATYLGVVLAGGPRAVTRARARAIVLGSRGAPVFGVFGSQSVDQILDITSAAGLAGAQLHAEYGSEDAARLRAAGLVVWQVVRIAAPGDLDRLESTGGADAVLVEPWVAHAAGGTGISLDLAAAREARVRLAGRRMVLAGGLTPGSVGRAAALVRPDVVDVSSGVEHLPGIKDPVKIAAFLEAVFGPSAIS
jgi:phosphoribosylanthranilate isomerase